MTEQGTPFKTYRLNKTTLNIIDTTTIAESGRNTVCENSNFVYSPGQFGMYSFNKTTLSYLKGTLLSNTHGETCWANENIVLRGDGAYKLTSFNANDMNRLQSIDYGIGEIQSLTGVSDEGYIGLTNSVLALNVSNISQTYWTTTTRTRTIY